MFAQCYKTVFLNATITLFLLLKVWLDIIRSESYSAELAYKLWYFLDELFQKCRYKLFTMAAV